MEVTMTQRKRLFIVTRVRLWDSLAVQSPFGYLVSLNLDSEITDMYGFCPVYDSREAAEVAYPGAQVIEVEVMAELGSLKGGEDAANIMEARCSTK